MTTATIVGFSGTPVRRAASVKTPVYHGPEGVYSPEPPSVPGRPLYDRRQIDDFEASGLVTLPGRNWGAEEGDTLLYAHRDFVHFLDSPLVEQFHSKNYDEKSDLYLHCLPWARATKQLAEWGRFLLAAARLHLGEPNLEAALAALDRARFTFLPKEHRDLRKEMFVLLLVARSRSGGNVDAVLRYAALDFPNDTDSLRHRAEQYPTIAAGGHRDAEEETP